MLGTGSALLQLALIAFTAWFLPRRLTTNRVGLLIFLGGVPLMWFGFSVLAMFLDSLTGNDVPGAGYLFEAFLSGVIGFFIYVSRRSKHKAA